MVPKNLRTVKWERSVPSIPVDNLISSDFPKYMPQNWKFMEGEPKMSLVLAHEYQRLWIEERNALHKKMYPENTAIDVDVVKRYIVNFKKMNTPSKPEPKKPFIMKKFQNIPSVNKNVRQPGDKVLAYLKNKEKKQKNNNKIKD